LLKKNVTQTNRPAAGIEISAWRTRGSGREHSIRGVSALAVRAIARKNPPPRRARGFAVKRGTCTNGKSTGRPDRWLVTHRRAPGVRCSRANRFASGTSRSKVLRNDPSLRHDVCDLTAHQHSQLHAVRLGRDFSGNHTAHRFTAHAGGDLSRASEAKKTRALRALIFPNLKEAKALGRFPLRPRYAKRDIFHSPQQGVTSFDALAKDYAETVLLPNDSSWSRLRRAGRVLVRGTEYAHESDFDCRGAER